MKINIEELFENENDVDNINRRKYHTILKHDQIDYKMLTKSL